MLLSEWFDLQIQYLPYVLSIYVSSITFVCQIGAHYCLLCSTIFLLLPKANYRVIWDFAHWIFQVNSNFDTNLIKICLILFPIFCWSILETFGFHLESEMSGCTFSPLLCTLLIAFLEKVQSLAFFQSKAFTKGHFVALTNLTVDALVAISTNKCSRILALKPTDFNLTFRKFIF